MIIHFLLSGNIPIVFANIFRNIENSRLFSPTGKNLVSKPPHKMEEAEPRHGRQQSNSPPASFFLSRRPAFRGRAVICAARRPLRLRWRGSSLRALVLPSPGWTPSPRAGTLAQRVIGAQCREAERGEVK